MHLQGSGSGTEVTKPRGEVKDEGGVDVFSCCDHERVSGDYVIVSLSFIRCWFFFYIDLSLAKEAQGHLRLRREEGVEVGDRAGQQC